MIIDFVIIYKSINCTAFLAAVLGLVSLTLTMVGTIGCSTFEINLLNKGYTNDSTGQNVTAEFNIQFSPYLFRTTVSVNEQYNTQCKVLPSLLKYDRKWKSAAILPIVSWIIVIFNIAALLGLMCCSPEKASFPFIGFMFTVINTTMNGLIFLILRSTTCTTITTFLSAVIGSSSSGGHLTCDTGPAFPYTVAGICGYFVTGLICLGCGNIVSSSSSSKRSSSHHSDPEPKQSNEEHQHQQQQQDADDNA